MTPKSRIEVFDAQICLAGAPVLLNMTNDSFFRMTAIPYLKLTLHAFSQIENVAASHHANANSIHILSFTKSLNYYNLPENFHVSQSKYPCQAATGVARGHPSSLEFDTIENRSAIILRRSNLSENK
jgi:hypothetical protein